jgi:cobalt-zinc-cadmium efflux system membrane fusion protein
MNKQVLSLPVLMGLLQFAGWGTPAAKPAQPPLEIAEREQSSSAKDKDEDQDADGGVAQKKGKQPSSRPQSKDELSDKSVTEKAVKEPGSDDQDEHEAAGKNIKEKAEPNQVGRVELSEKKTKNANLDVEIAGPAKINATLQLSGKITLNEDAVANVSPRYPGVVKAVYKRLGDRVQKGEALAMIESNDSLRDYQVNSEISGTIIKKEVTIGEVARDDKPIFTVADLSTVWVDFSVFPQDFRRLKPGQVVQIDYADNISARGKITYIAPFGSENTQSMLARAVVQNPDGLLRPGLFVTGELLVEEIEVPIAVRPGAIQTVNEKTVVFVAEGAAFEAREVELGTSDGNYAQVLAGLNAGDRYVADNSFLLKAELGKGEVQDSD